MSPLHYSRNAPRLHNFSSLCCPLTVSFFSLPFVWFGSEGSDGCAPYNGGAVPQVAVRLKGSLCSFQVWANYCNGLPVVSRPGKCQEGCSRVFSPSSTKPEASPDNAEAAVRCGT